jgi:hypothetical protein
MAYDPKLLQALIDHPSESLPVEIKGWLDLKTPEHQAKVAKACMALRNLNGGHLILGIDNGTMKLDEKNAKPADVHVAYNSDAIQEIVSRHSSDPFAVEVRFVDSGGKVFPVICVPAGVTTVVAAKKGLMDGAKQEHLIKEHQVYVRTVRTNGTFSTSEARHDVWKEIMETCMDNREADVARFLRRHFGDRDVPAAITALNTTVNSRLKLLQEESYQRFLTVVDKQARNIPNYGYWDATAIIDGEIPLGLGCNQAFLNLLTKSNPHLTGRPQWSTNNNSFAFGMDSPIDKFWERAWVTPVPQPGQLVPRMIDFWRVSPQGQFYVLRMLEDDLEPPTTNLTPLAALDYLLVIWRIAEVILVSLAFAKAMGCDPDKCSIDYLFTWSKLKGRQLAAWSDPGRGTHSGKAQQDSIKTRIKVPLSVSNSAIAPYVHAAVHEVFELFGGTDVRLPEVEGQVTRLLGGR